MSTSLYNASESAPQNGKRRIPDFTGPHRVVCEPCHQRKLKCDRGHPCSRCIKKQVECIYAPAPARKTHPTGPDWKAILDTIERPVTTTTWSEYRSSFSSVDLLCPVDVERVKTRWLEGFASALDRQPKALGPGVTFFTLTTLRSWPRMLTQSGTGSPPFIHPSQLQNSDYPPSLARCVTIAHMWANQADGGHIVRETILREAQALFESDGLSSHNDMERLVTWQAYLLLCLMLLPPCTAEPMTIPQEIKINLQELTARCAKEGLLCPAEQTGSRPDYLSWILAETKRRTLYAAYMFDDILNTLSNMPCVLGDELGILPITCSKTLWLACSSEETWEQEYNITLASGKYLRLEELWIHPADEKTRKRRERWLAAVDEFGLMIYAVASISQLH